jgi:hypothetical protein
LSIILYNPHEMQLPLAVCSDERGTWINGDDWILSLKDMPLSEVTQETVRSAMNASASWAPVLSEERELLDGGADEPRAHTSHAPSP